MNAVQKVCLVLSSLIKTTRAHFQNEKDRKATVRQDTTLILGGSRRVSK